MLKERPQNLAILLRKAVSKLVKAATSKGPLKSGAHSPVLNCAALLTRLLPVLFESEKEHHFVETVFWRGDLPASSGSAPAAETKKNSVPEVVPDESTREPLAAPLIDAILALLFKHEFTLATASDTAVWEGGMGGSAASGKGTQYDAARADILKLFLVSCSETLFVTPGQRICLASYSLCMNVDFTSPLGGMPGMIRDSRSENLGAAAAAAAGRRRVQGGGEQVAELLHVAERGGVEPRPRLPLQRHLQLRPGRRPPPPPPCARASRSVCGGAPTLRAAQTGCGRGSTLSPSTPAVVCCVRARQSACPASRAPACLAWASARHGLDG